MSDILEFPTTAARAAHYLELHLREMLKERGADEELVQFTLHSLKSVFAEMAEAEKLSFKVDIPAGLNDDAKAMLQEQIAKGIETMQGVHHQSMVKLAARLVLTEMKLFQVTRPEERDA